MQERFDITGEILEREMKDYYLYHDITNARGDSDGEGAKHTGGRSLKQSKKEQVKVRSEMVDATSEQVETRSEQMEDPVESVFD